MKNSAFAALGACALGAAWALPSAAADETVPDFYANGYSWSHISNEANGFSGKNFEPPPAGAPGAKGPIGWHPDYPHVGNGTPGKEPTPRIGNDGNPLLLPWAAAEMKRTRERIVAGGVPYDPAARCWPAGVPGVITFANQPMEIRQTPQEVLFLYSRGQVTRHIYMNVPHSKDLHPSWYGESVGHYENGDTLVIDTVGMNDKTPIDVFNVPHTKALHVIERYKLYDNSNKIELTITVDDPGAFKQTFSMGKTMEPAKDPIGEVLCQVNNDDVFGQGLKPVPTAATYDF